MSEATAPVVDIALRAQQFVRLRDKIKEIQEKHDAELAPYKEARMQLEGIFQTALEGANVTSMKTTGGTITATERSSATVENTEAFRSFVVNMGEWDLADIKANAPAVKSWAEQNQQLPPGVKFSTIKTISVRRPSSS